MGSAFRPVICILRSKGNLLESPHQEPAEKPAPRHPPSPPHTLSALPRLRASQPAAASALASPAGAASAPQRHPGPLPVAALPSPRAREGHGGATAYFDSHLAGLLPQPSPCPFPRAPPSIFSPSRRPTASLGPAAPLLEAGTARGAAGGGNSSGRPSLARNAPSSASGSLPLGN